MSIEQLMSRKTHCFYCEIKLILPKSIRAHKNRLTKDHIIAKSAGGRSHHINYVHCCKKCNKRKGSLTLEEYLDKMCRDYYEYWKVKLLMTYRDEKGAQLYNAGKYEEMLRNELNRIRQSKILARYLEQTSQYIHVNGETKEIEFKEENKT